MKYIYLLIFLIPTLILAQDDLLSEIDVETEDDYKSAAFKGLKIVNFESTKMVSKNGPK